MYMAMKYGVICLPLILQTLTHFQTEFLRRS